MERPGNRPAIRAGLEKSRDAIPVSVVDPVASSIGAVNGSDPRYGGGANVGCHPQEKPQRASHRFVGP